ncbi:MAG: Type 1 glutamine amidotransferase-like domain-containing protein [Candidatus Micrarchaeota archaeon]
MSTILLTSAGIASEIRSQFRDLLPKPAGEIKAVFITTGAYSKPLEMSDGKEPSWMTTDRQSLFDAGITQVEDLDIRDKTSTELEKILVDKDVIFVSGGNVFFLMHWVKKTGFDKLLYGLLKRGIVYVGSSGGTYLMCESLEMALWKNPKRDTFGLSKKEPGLAVVHFLISPHFVEKNKIIIDNASRSTNFPIVALTDKQAVLVKGKTVKLLGTREKNYWNGFKEVA